MTTVTPDDGVLSTALMGFWAFLGVVMRGKSDWRDPKSGKFSIMLFGASIATALVMGEIAAAIGQHYGWEPVVTRALAAALAYIGPAATIQILKDRFLGGRNVVANAGADTEGG